MVRVMMMVKILIYLEQKNKLFDDNVPVNQSTPKRGRVGRPKG